MKLSIYSYTNQGGREHNEDSLRWTSDGTEGVFVLADGLGGHDRGEVASQLAVEAICGGEDSPVPGREELLERFRQANARILEQQKQPGQEEMKTTAVALSLSGGTAAWAHIGDSRLYRCSQGKLDQLTRDHSVTYMKYLGGEISYMDVYHDDDRSSLLRAMGNPVCSDGFWEFVYNEEMLVDCLKSRTPEEWARRMLLRHIRRTPPGNDNFSLIAVFVEE